MKKVGSLLLLLIVCWSFNSCSGDCFCEKQLGCGVLTVKKRTTVLTNIIITQKTFCSQKDYYSDVVLRDSIRAFIDHYTTDSSYVDVKDSIYKQYDRVQVKRNMQRYTDSGYMCACPI